MRSFRGEDGFNEFVSALGGDPAAVTKAAGLAPSLPKGLINFEPFSGVCKLFEEAALQTNEPCFGLKWAFHQPTDFRFSGPNVLLVAMSENARQWVDMAIEYQKVHTNGCSFHYEEDPSAGTLTGVASMHPLAPPSRQFVEQILAGISLIAHQFLPDFKLKEVTFQHGPPKDMALYEKAFKCPVVFNADRTTITTSLHFLEKKQTPLLTKAISPFLKKYMDWRIYKHPEAQQSIAMMIAETLPAILGVEGSDIKHVSETLNIHPKKLQRLLKEEGTSYSQVLDEVRKHIAARLLVDSDISIIRLARMLDYSSDRPFTAASKRWFGMSATKYRQKFRA